MFSTYPERGPVREEPVVATLEEAHEVLRRQQPEWCAPAEEWAAFHRHSAMVYAEMAEVDRRQWEQAMLWVEIAARRSRYALRRAQGREDELDPGLAGEYS